MKMPNMGVMYKIGSLFGYDHFMCPVTGKHTWTGVYDTGYGISVHNGPDRSTKVYYKPAHALQVSKKALELPPRELACRVYELVTTVPRTRPLATSEETSIEFILEGLYGFQFMGQEPAPDIINRI